MNKHGKTKSLILVLSSTVSKTGDVLFDYVNNMFLVGINLNSLVLVGVYQLLESIMGVLFDVFGGAIDDRFRRKKLLFYQIF